MAGVSLITQALAALKTAKDATQAGGGSTTSPTTNSNFLTIIPAELRNSIYEHIFSPEPTTKGDSVNILFINPPTCSLVLVCKQILAETKVMARQAFLKYWSETSFTVCAYKLQELQFLRNLSDARLELITEIRCPAPPPDPPFNLITIELVTAMLIKEEGHWYIDIEWLICGPVKQPNYERLHTKGNCDSALVELEEYLDRKLKSHARIEVDSWDSGK